MGIMDFFFGKKAKTKREPLYTPQQEELLNQILSGAGGPLAGGLQNLQNILGGGPEAFEAFERPARREFEQETLPTIAERFTGQFGEGSQRSSAFGQALGVAGRELEENLAGQRAGLQSGALKQLMQLLSSAMGPREQQYIRPRQRGLIESIGIPAAQGAMKALPFLL